MATELPHPDDLEFAPIRADLARLYLAHKYELSMADWPDDEIVARTSDISAPLVALTMHARQNGDRVARPARMVPRGPARAARRRRRGALLDG